MGRKLSQDEYINKAIKIHGDIYDYSKTIYIGIKEDITFKCKKHGYKKVSADKHLHQKQGCKECSNEKLSKLNTYTNEEFIELANNKHNGKYQYDSVVYKGTNIKVSITCKEHGDFPQTPHKHLIGDGCPDCAGNKRKNTKKFIRDANKVHDNLYNYDKTMYINAQEELTITCVYHGDFFQTAHNHLRGTGCPDCYGKKEYRVYKYISKKTNVERQYKIKNKFYDFFLIDFNLLIERDGEQHYRNNYLFSKDKTNYLKYQCDNDKFKTSLAKKNGFKIARIPYWLTKKEEEVEIENILAGKPTYPDVPDLKQEKTKPRPIKNF